MARRRAPTRLVVPSATRLGPNRISSSPATAPDLDPLAAGQLGVVRLRAPVEAAPGGVGGAGERGTEHHGIRAAGDRLDDVAAGAHAAVGDDVHVAAAGLVEVVAPRGGDVGDGRRHRRVDAERAPGGVRGAAAEADEHAGRAGAHEVQRGRVGGRAADDHGHVELVDEALEVQRLGAARDVLGRDGGAADDEEVDPGVDDGLPQLLGALRGEGTGDGDTRRRGSRAAAR